MSATAEETAERLARSLLQFTKMYRQFGRAEWQQGFSGCKQGEIGVLFMISHGAKAEGREMKVSEISKMMHVTSPTITQFIKGLEANGLVERHIDPNDRRSVGIALTEKGEEVARQAHEAMIANFRGLAEYLGEEQSEQLATLVHKASRYFHEKLSALYPLPWNGDEEV